MQHSGDMSPEHCVLEDGKHGGGHWNVVDVWNHAEPGVSVRGRMGRKGLL